MLEATIHSPRVLTRYRRVREASVAMCAPLSPEEYRLQPIDDVSPPWWNLGHTSWFFARNVLAEFGGGREPEDEQYDYLLNSYYQSLGARLPRGQRGSISRPTTDDVLRYRQSVDHRIVELLERDDVPNRDEMLKIVEIGIEHEQQHQELYYTEIKFIRHQNPRELREPLVAVHPTRTATTTQEPSVAPLRFIKFEGGLHEFGNREGGWGWDNEFPIHRAYLEPFALADRLVTNGEYLEFMEDGGYRQPLLWLDNGWSAVQQQRWRAPLYWEQVDGEWWHWTLQGMRPVLLDEPVCHVSFYEADAFAQWKSQTSPDAAGIRLPSECEWEHAVRHAGAPLPDDAFSDAGLAHPTVACPTQGIGQTGGCLWQWTTSYYEPYPGYRPFGGVLAEYNGKFMDNQRVLRGGSCATPRDHYRLSYRNFWPANTQFQFTGIRLASTGLPHA